MKFKQKLSAEVEQRVQAADKLLHDPARLDSLARTRLMGTPNEAAFDRLSALAALILRVPLTIISLVGEDKQFFKSGYGLPAPYDTLREVPINASICRYTLANEPIIASEASADALLMSHPTTEPWGIAAFIAIPMKDHRGHVLGAFCAVDTKVHAWTAEEVQIMTQLTESVMTEIELREKLLELEDEKLARETLVAALTHDLRTPIAAAKMASEALIEDYGTEEGVTMIDIISRNMDRADRMIHDILDASRLKSGEEVQLLFAPADLREIVSTTVSTLTRVHGPRFKVYFSGEIDGKISGIWDASALERVLENLGSNAVKYGASDRKITLSASGSDRTVQVRVHNFGMPIAEKNLETIFDRYTRTESAERGPQKGWGIGLTLVKGFTEAHGGKIHVESSEENGTTFVIELPRKAAHS